MTFKAQPKLTFVLFVSLLLIFLGITTWMVLPYLLAVLMGAILATLARPLHRRLLRRGMGQTSSALVVTLAVILLVVVPVAALSTLAVQQGIHLGEKLAQEGVFDLDVILQKVASIGPVQELIGSPQEIEQQVRAQAKSVGSAASGFLIALVGGIPDRILQVFLALLTCFFMLADGPRFIRYLNDKIPLDSDVRAHLYGALRDTTISVIWATLAAAALQAVIMFTAYATLGIGGSALAAGATFIFAWIPLIGSTPVWLLGALILFTQGSIAKMVIMLAFGAICGVSDNIVRAYVLKGRSDIHPLVSLLAIFGGIQLFGLFGVFFGPIIAAVLLALLQVWPVVARRFELVSARPEPVVVANAAEEEAPVRSGLARKSANSRQPEEEAEKRKPGSA